jgi:hypothetical protein
VDSTCKVAAEKLFGSMMLPHSAMVMLKVMESAILKYGGIDVAPDKERDSDWEGAEEGSSR